MADVRILLPPLRDGSSTLFLNFSSLLTSQYPHLSVPCPSSPNSSKEGGSEDEEEEAAESDEEGMKDGVPQLPTFSKLNNIENQRQRWRGILHKYTLHGSFHPMVSALAGAAADGEGQEFECGESESGAEDSEHSDGSLEEVIGDVGAGEGSAS